MDDAELVRQVLQGNQGAYVELLKRYTAQIAALCRAHIPRYEIVEDLVQETFLRGLDRLSSLQQPDSFGPWLYAIARNLCRDWLNDPYHQHLPLDGAAPLLAAPRTAEMEDGLDRTADLKQCVRQLPVELREVVEIYYAGGRVTYQEMAQRLGVSFGQVNKLLTRARKILRVCLEGRNATMSSSV
jgi:RNA polymerase sigma-70 factor (ECF subfamily)